MTAAKLQPCRYASIVSMTVPDLGGSPSFPFPTRHSSRFARATTCLCSFLSSQKGRDRGLTRSLKMELSTSSIPTCHETVGKALQSQGHRCKPARPSRTWKIGRIAPAPTALIPTLSMGPFGRWPTLRYCGDQLLIDNEVVQRLFNLIKHLVKRVTVVNIAWPMVNLVHKTLVGDLAVIRH